MDFSQEKERFDSIFNRYYWIIVAYARCRLGNEGHMAEDIAADTFRILWEKRALDFPNEKMLSAFLYQTAYHLILHCKREKKFYVVSLDELIDRLGQDPEGEEPYVSESEDPFAGLEREDFLRIFKKELTELDYQMLLVCVDSDFNGEAISEAFGVSLATAYMRISRLRVRLKEILRSLREQSLL